MILCRAARWNLNPASDALFAFLYDGEIDRRAGLQVVRYGSDKNEFVVIGVRQLAARPRDLGHALAHLGVTQRKGFREFCALGLELPAWFRHRLDVDNTVRDADA